MGKQDPLVMHHVRSIEFYVLDYASSRHGRHYAPSEFSSAVAGLYSEKEDVRPRVFGITASSSVFISYGPLFLIVLCFELWRRVRRMPVFYVRNTVFWFGFDTQDAFGKWVGMVYALVPLVATIITYASYAVSTQASFVSFEEWSWLMERAGLVESYQDLTVWLPFGILPTLVFFLVPLHLYFSFSTSIALIKIVGTSARRNAARSS